MIAGLCSEGRDSDSAGDSGQVQRMAGEQRPPAFFQKEGDRYEKPSILSLRRITWDCVFRSASNSPEGNGRARRRRQAGSQTSNRGYVRDHQGHQDRTLRTHNRAIRRGVHLIVQAQDNRTINLHLGPASPLADIVQKLAPSQEITFEAFRTDRMPKDAYVAKSLTAGGKTFALRNDSLRPKWASRRAGKGGGRGMGGGLGQGSCYW